MKMTVPNDNEESSQIAIHLKLNKSIRMQKLVTFNFYLGRITSGSFLNKGKFYFEKKNSFLFLIAFFFMRIECLHVCHYEKHISRNRLPDL